jgi:hypothetical protein
LAATTAIQLVNVRKPRDPRIWTRLTAATLLAALAAAGGTISAHALTIGVAALAIAAILAEASLASPQQPGLDATEKPSPTRRHA